MNTIFIIAALAACMFSCHAESFNFENRIECLRASHNRIGESTIRKALEKLREVLKNGIPDINVPPFDPLNINDQHISVDNKFLSLNAILSAQSTGAAGFDITKLSLSLIGLNFKLILTWPKFVIAGNYDVNMNSSFTSHNLFGNGLFELNTQNLVFGMNGKIALKLINGKLTPQLKKLEVSLTIEKFLLNITGVMGDEELSGQISTYLTDNLPELLAKNQEWINKIIAENLDLINKILAGNKIFGYNDKNKLASYIINCGEFEF